MSKSKREITNQENEFKEALDTYLYAVPDHHKIRDLIQAAVVHQITGRHFNSLFAWNKVET